MDKNRKEKVTVDLAIQVDFEQEVDIARFLGVYIKHNHTTGFLYDTKWPDQTVLDTHGVIVGITNEKFTPAKGNLFPNKHMESLLLVILTTAVLMECFCILLVTQNSVFLILPTLL